MKVEMITAMDQRGVIGVDGRLPWHIPEDLQRFKKLTRGQAIIMGRKTWDSLPKKPLPDRENIVVSSWPKSYYPAHQRYSLKDAVELAEKLGIETAFIIGGMQMYREAAEFAEKIHMTLVFQPAETHKSLDVTYFPTSILDQFRRSRVETHVDHLFITMVKR